MTAVKGEIEIRPADVYSGRGFWSWLLQRMTGLLLTFFIGFHIIALHLIRQGPIDTVGVFERLRDSPPMIGFYFLFSGIVIFHAFNGVWGVALDFSPPAAGRRVLAFTLTLGGFWLFLYAVYVLGALTRLE